MRDTGVYPFSTQLERSVSILSLAFRHEVDRKSGETWRGRVGELGWRPHDFLRGTGPRSGRRDESVQEVTPFLPHLIFTPNAQAMAFGFKGVRDARVGDDAILSRWLARKGHGQEDDSRGSRGSLLLTLEPSPENLLRQPLELNSPSGARVRFRIEWADAWFFPDRTGVLALKVHIESVAEDGRTRAPRVADLTRLNRALREIDDGRVTVNVVGEKNAVRPWSTLVLERWLGAATPSHINLLGTRSSAAEVFRDQVDRYTRYAKLLTLARVPSVAEGEGEFLWNAPVTDPPFDFKPYYPHARDNDWHDIFGAYHFATMEGYPTYGDYLLYDLASCSDEGAAGGFDGQRGWRVSPEYLRAALSDYGIEIWEYWRGMALHDTLAFLAYDESMPIEWQAEAYYYPLHVYLYHVQFRLNCFSEEIIDQELNDVMRARHIKDDFNKFRNQYWFRDVTVDFQGVEVTNKLKAGLEVNEFYETVQAEVSEISDFISDKIDRGKQSLIAFVILGFYPVAYIFETAGVNAALDRFSDSNPALAVSLAAALLVVIAGLSARFMPRITEAVQRVANWFYKFTQ